MKKLLLFLSFCLILGTIYGQLPNSSFEGWNSTPYDEPTGWQTGNHESVSLGLTPVTKVTGQTGYAVRMQTLVSNGDTAQAYIANGDPKGYGGIPFAAQPTAITGFYRYNLPVNDTAILLVIFKNGGSVFSQNIFKIKGTGSQNTFTPFSFPLSVTSMPDSVIIAAASSNLIDNIGVENGSFLELDGIGFAGTNITVDNSSFENWTTHSDDALQGWETYGEGVSKTTDSYEGNYAISLTTVDYGNGDMGTSGMTSGHNTNNGPTGGTPYTETIDTLVGFYKYSANGPDSAQINIGLLKNSNYVSGSSLFLAPAAQYTYFEIPISSGTTPDTMRVDISSSKWPMSPSAAGSTLILDNLQLKSVIAAGTQTSESKKKENVFSFPNPAKDILHIHFINNTSENVNVEIYDMTGRLIMTDKKNVYDSNMDINVSSLKTGNYIYRISGSKIKFEKIFTKE